MSLYPTFIIPLNIYLRDSELLVTLVLVAIDNLLQGGISLFD